MKGANTKLVIGRSTYLRQKRTGKAVEVCKSPYMARVVDPNDISSAQEKLIWRWVMQNAADKRDDIIFKYRQIMRKRGEFFSLAGKKELCMNVLDAWTVYLNTKEKVRSSTSPCRLFAKSIPCLYTMEHALPENEAYEVFKEAMLLALENVKPEIKMEDVDLFFFPICNPNTVMLCA
ncbi:unnamed protein product [Cuscuta europaea]|uniref:Uncharacterized protein n=1 Tax=Cuscuta europaea TaxID=41803 RepID=A0A9P0YFW0_CUSEU|nr:unnamed protein product [Cuscuta europaea]